MPLAPIAAGETLVVARLDRLARSVSHLLAVIEQLEARGAHFRSLRDPIDTSTPQGMFSLQVLGAVAKLERALIAERTKAGLSVDGVLARLDAWLPTVRRMRPDQPWGDVVRVLNRGHAATWTIERLRRTVRRLVSEGIVEADLLDRARPQRSDDRLIRLIAGIAAAAAERTLQQIAAQLETKRERTPRGGTRWHRSSIKHLLARAEERGLDGRRAIPARR
jgi:Resolvase, N terminal domain